MNMGGSVTVHAWMWSETGLGLGWSSPKLAVYALVYQISDGGMGVLTATSFEVAEQLGMAPAHVRHTLSDLKSAGLIRQAGKVRLEGRRGRPVPCYAAVGEVAARAIEACAAELRSVENPDPEPIYGPEGSINTPNYGPERSINTPIYGPEGSINLNVSERSINTPTSGNEEFSTLNVSERSINTPTSGNEEFSTTPYNNSNNYINSIYLSHLREIDIDDSLVTREIVENLTRDVLEAYPASPSDAAVAQAIPRLMDLLADGVRPETIVGAVRDYSASLEAKRLQDPNFGPIGFPKFFGREWTGGKLSPWLADRVGADGRVKLRPAEPDRLMKATDPSGLWLMRTGGRLVAVDVDPGATREEAEAAWSRQSAARPQARGFRAP